MACASSAWWSTAHSTAEEMIHRNMLEPRLGITPGIEVIDQSLRAFPTCWLIVCPWAILQVVLQQITEHGTSVWTLTHQLAEHAVTRLQIVDGALKLRGFIASRFALRSPHLSCRGGRPIAELRRLEVLHERLTLDLIALVSAAQVRIRRRSRSGHQPVEQICTVAWRGEDALNEREALIRIRFGIL